VIVSNIVWFFLKQEELLRSKDWSWSSYTNPSDKLFCWNLIMFHGIYSYQSSCSSKSCFAVNSNSSWVRCLEMSFTNIHEIINNFIWWVWTIYKEQICVRYSILDKLLSIILSLVESDNFLDVPELEYFTVLFWSEAWPLILLSLVNRSHKSHKLAWNDPVQVSIIYSFIELILLDIECLEVIPVVFDSLFQSLETV